MRTTSVPGRVPPQVVGDDALALGEGAAPAPGSEWVPRGGANRMSGLYLVITGAMGLLAAWVITLDELKLLKDPDFVPGCSLNPVVACGTIMKSEQATVFGFPHPMLGLVAYPVVIRVVFCGWLQFQSLYRINSLRLWCSRAKSALITQPSR